MQPNDSDALPAADELKFIFKTLLHRQHLTKIVVEQWNGEAVTLTQEGVLLKEIGAESDKKSLVLWQSQLK
jgi:ATP-dependent Lhr-like helicase